MREAPFRNFGRTSAANTNTAVASLRSTGLSPMRSATAISARKPSAPSATMMIVAPKPQRFGFSVSPRITAAMPPTSVPTPIPTSAKP